jgi:hypothetical protein
MKDTQSRLTWNDLFCAAREARDARPLTQGLLGHLAVKLRGTGEATASTPQSGTNGVLLGWTSVADLSPIRKCVETRGEGKLLLAGAVRIDQNELELTASPHTPVEHDLLAIG